MFLIILILLLISGCTAEDESCADPDDFGQKISVKVESRFEKGDKVNFTALNGEDGSLDPVNQVLKWQDLGLYTDGNILLAKVKGKWTSWADGNVEEHRVCSNFIDKDGFSEIKVDANYLSSDIEDKDGNIYYGPPCWFSGGYALYILLYPDGLKYEKIKKDKQNEEMRYGKASQSTIELFDKYTREHPNGTLENIRNPNTANTPVLSFYGEHREKNPRIWLQDNVLDSSSNSKVERNWKIYAKISDRYYYDNGGAYEIEFISGVQRYTSSGVFGAIRSFVKSKIYRATAKYFTNITNNPEYKSLVLGSLVLFVMISSLGYMTGISKAEMSDFLKRLLKVFFVTAMLSPTSWKFFSENLFNIFLHGVDEIIGIIGSNLQSSTISDPTAFLDSFFTRFFSGAIWSKKIPALLAADFALGLLWIIVMVLIVGVILYLSIQMFVIYLSGVIACGFIISLAPIFVICALFPPLKDMFDGFFKLLISYSLQSIMSFVLIIFLMTMVNNEMYRTLGYGACNNVVYKFGACISKSFCVDIKDFKGYHPGTGFIPARTIDEPYIDEKDKISNRCIHDKSLNDNMPIPPDYKKTGKRYVALPFLDPNIEDDMSKISDMFSCKMVDLSELAILALMAFIVFFLKGTVSEIGQLVSGANQFGGSANNVFAGALRGNPLYQMTVGRAKRGIQDKIGGKIDGVKDKIARATHGTISRGSSAMKSVRKYDNKRLKHSIQDTIGGNIDFTKKHLNIIKGIGRESANLAVYGATRPLYKLTKSKNLKFGRTPLSKLPTPSRVSSLYKEHMEGVNYIHSVRSKIGKDKYSLYKAAKDKKIPNDLGPKKAKRANTTSDILSRDTDD